MKKIYGLSFFVLAVLVCAVGYRIDKLYAQATTGFTKVNTVPITDTTFTTPALIDGTIYTFEATAVDAAGRESLPSTIIGAVIPPTLTHTVTLNWIADPSNPPANILTYNIYDKVVTTPNPPGALSLKVN